MTQALDIRLAVDGGGSGCRAVLVDGTGRRLGLGAGPAANVTTDFDAALAAVNAAVAEAGRAAGLDAAQVRDAPAWVGLAGAIDAETCARVAAALPQRRATVTDDRPTAMAGALGGADGCLVAAGTGSFLGRQAGGQRRFVGGWGLVLADQASGVWLGRRLLAALVDWQDGLGPGAPVLTAVLDRFGSAAAVSRFSIKASPADFAALAPRVTAAAGDAVARGLMQEGADWIVRGLAALGRRAGEPVCLTGGIGPHYAAWLPQDMTAALVAPQGTPLDGAVRLALGLRR